MTRGNPSNWENTFAQPQTFQKKKKRKMSPVSSIAPKTARSPLCSQNVSYLVKVEGGKFRQKKGTNWERLKSALYLKLKKRSF